MSGDFASIFGSIDATKLPPIDATPDAIPVSLDGMKYLEYLRPYMLEDSVTDILINGPDRVFVERYGKLEHIPVTFPSDTALLELGAAIAAQVGRSINPRKPLVDARLQDGSRVNIIAPPLSVDGTNISIRKFSRRPITLETMAEQHNISASLADFLRVCGRCRMNIIISGGTGSGKTTLLNAISQHIDPHERIVTIEDAAELRLQQPHVVRLETRPYSFGMDRDEEVTMRDLVRNALRMRPDRILVGEVRGAEAFDMLQAMNTGHEGSFTTVHANHPRDALARLENMVNMANMNLPPLAIRQQIASAVHFIVQISRMRDGVRRVTYISEIVGMEGEVVTMQDIYSFQARGETADGKIKGEFKWSGIMPRIAKRVAYYGQLEALSKALGVRIPGL
ncbi:MAG: secretion system protein E [Alphaproteobacteria bacterium]|nr:secretion system protein E [Alphaproteobacteria bacterium]